MWGKSYLRHHPAQPPTPGGCFLAPPRNHPGWFLGGAADVTFLLLWCELVCARFLTELDFNTEKPRGLAPQMISYFSLLSDMIFSDLLTLSGRKASARLIVASFRKKSPSMNNKNFDDWVAHHSCLMVRRREIIEYTAEATPVENLRCLYTDLRVNALLLLRLNSAPAPQFIDWCAHAFWRSCI